MGYLLQKEAEATQGGRKEPGRRACPPGEIRDRGGGGRWLLRRERPSLAQPRRCLKGEEGAAGGRPAPTGRCQGVAAEPRGSLSLAGSPRTKQGPVPRVEVGVTHPEPQGACCMLGGGGGADTTFLPSTLPPSMLLMCPTNPEVPGEQGDPQVVADRAEGWSKGERGHGGHKCARTHTQRAHSYSRGGRRPHLLQAVS